MKRARNYFLFLKPFSALAKIYKENKRIIKWKLFGERIDRNQWSSEKENSWETYKQLMSWSWEETKSNAPQYFERLNFIVRKCRGRVLEIGCGIGTMTKFISRSNKVTEIVAIDAYPITIEELKSYNLPKVTALEMPLENIKFGDTRKFDTVLICEVIEHIYPDEEMKMLNTLRPYIDSKTAFIVSTPIGWMPDTYHVRGFSKKNFKRHLKKYYGTPKEIDLSSGYSQVVFGWFNFKDKMRTTMSNEERNMENYTNHVKKQFKSNNLWYTGSQFAWAEKESIKRIYDQRFLFFYKIIKREIERKGKITLLDYGCGDGYWSLFFSQLSACEVTGVDYNPLRLERARSIVKNAKFIEADLRNVKEQLGKFDMVFCSQVIEHIKDDVSFLKGIRTHLKNDGVLILGTPNEGSLTHRFRNYITKGESDHVHFYTEKEIKYKIEQSGFIIINIYREVFFLGFDKLYYRLTSTDFGFKLLELLAIMFPSQCSDYFFECKMR